MNGGALFGAALGLFVAHGAAQAETFTYRGQLQDNGVAAQGEYDLRLTLHADRFGATPLASSVEVTQVAVRDGRFVARIELPELSPERADAWLEVAVRPAGDADFWPLPERAPVALKAAACPASWALEGNAGTDPAVNFLGTTDEAPLVLRAMQGAELQLEASPLADNSPSCFSPAGTRLSANVRMGFLENRIAPGVQGATLLGGGACGHGGGALPRRNEVNGDFGIVIGGVQARAGAESIVVGGVQNRASDGGLALGGFFNTASNESVLINTQVGTASRPGAAAIGGGGHQAAGDRSLALGTKSIVRSAAQAGEDAIACDALGQCGDEGVFVWSDASAVGNPFVPAGGFRSTGPNQFLVRASGGVVMQPLIGEEIDARSPRGFFNVVMGDSGVAAPVSMSADTAATFEGGQDTLVRILAPTDAVSGFVMGNAGDQTDGGVLYEGGINRLAFLSNGVSRMEIDGSGRVRVNTLGAAGTTVLCRNAQNQLATCSSAARYKHDIVDLDLGLDAVLALRPVGYRWNEGGDADVGFVAEEVAALDERLVTRDADGVVEGVKYDRLSAVLAVALQELAARDEARASEAVRARAEAAELRRAHDALAVRLRRIERLLANPARTPHSP